MPEQPLELFRPGIRPNMSPLERVDAYCAALLSIIPEEQRSPNARSILAEMLDDAMQYGVEQAKTETPNEINRISLNLPSLRKLTNP